jgi:hypothetical protein
MNTIKRTLKHTLIIAGLLTSTACLADEPQQQVAAKAPTALEQLVVKAEIDVEQTINKLQQQLTESIRQQASNAISNLAESIKTLAQ